MSEYILPLEILIEQFRKLPGVGRKTAVRYAMSILDMKENEVAEFAGAVLNAGKNVRRCPICNNITDLEICNICTDVDRQHIICVVEDARAIFSLERVRDFKVKYHVLGGALSPMNGIGPDQLKIGELLKRIKERTDVIFPFES